MKPNFTNHCVCTMNAFREVLLNYQLKKIKPSYIIIFALVVLLLYRSLSQESSTVLFYFVVLGGFGLFFAAMLPLITADQTYKRNFELFQCELESEYDFYDDHFVNTAWPSNSVVTIQYTQIKQVISTKNYYLLATNQNLVSFVDKEQFVNITVQEFESFMRKNAKNACFIL